MTDHATKYDAYQKSRHQLASIRVGGVIANE